MSEIIESHYSTYVGLGKSDNSKQLRFSKVQFMARNPKADEEKSLNNSRFSRAFSCLLAFDLFPLKQSRPRKRKGLIWRACPSPSSRLQTLQIQLSKQLSLVVSLPRPLKIDGRSLAKSLHSPKAGKNITALNARQL